MPALRILFTAVVMALVVWALLRGRPAEAVLLVVVAMALRRAAESGGLTRLVHRS